MSNLSIFKDCVSKEKKKSRERLGGDSKMMKRRNNHNIRHICNCTQKEGEKKKTTKKPK